MEYLLAPKKYFLMSICSENEHLQARVHICKTLSPFSTDMCLYDGGAASGAPAVPPTTAETTRTAAAVGKRSQVCNHLALPPINTTYHSSRRLT